MRNGLMRNLYLSEFKKHLKTAHLRTSFEYFEPREIAPDVAWGTITNEIVANGSRFSKMALYYHMKGDTSRLEVHPVLEGKALGQQTAINLLSEDGEDADLDEINAAVSEVRPDVLSFDPSILGCEEMGVVYVIDRDAPRTYCIQRDHRPDLVFEGVIHGWGYDVYTWSDWTRWINRIKYASLRDTITASRERTLFQGRKAIRTEREAGEFKTEDEADAFLHGGRSKTISRADLEEDTPALSFFCPFRGTRVAPRKKVYVGVRR